MPAGMFSIDSILAVRPRGKEALLLQQQQQPPPPTAAPAVIFSASLQQQQHGGESLYCGGGDYGGGGAYYSRAAVAPAASNLPALAGSRLGGGYGGSYYYGQLHVQASPVGGPACCGALQPLGAQQCSCVPATGKADRRRAFHLLAALGRERWNSQCQHFPPGFPSPKSRPPRAAPRPPPPKGPLGWNLNHGRRTGQVEGKITGAN